MTEATPSSDRAAARPQRARCHPRAAKRRRPRSARAGGAPVLRVGRGHARAPARRACRRRPRRRAHRRAHAEVQQRQPGRRRARRDVQAARAGRAHGQPRDRGCPTRRRSSASTRRSARRWKPRSERPPHEPSRAASGAGRLDRRRRSHDAHADPADAGAGRLRLPRGRARRRCAGALSPAAARHRAARRGHAAHGRLRGLRRAARDADRRLRSGAHAHRPGRRGVDRSRLRGRRHRLHQQADQLGHPQPPRALHPAREPGLQRPGEEPRGAGERPAHRPARQLGVGSPARPGALVRRDLPHPRADTGRRGRRASPPFLERVHPEDRPALQEAMRPAHPNRGVRQPRGARCNSPTASCATPSSSASARATPRVR